MAKAKSSATDKAANAAQGSPQEATGGAAGANTPAAAAKPQDGQRRGPQEATNRTETLYSAGDLAAAARARFGVPPEAARAALKLAGKERATLAEAQQLIKGFMERKVKK